jgi:hypothetical protein
MHRKVSLWIVIALVCALAATTAAVVVLATRDDGGSRATARQANGAWPRAGDDGQSGRQAPVMGDMRGAWGDGRDAPILPWVLFALATGTAVGLLVAWSPWKTAGAGAAVGPSSGSSPSTQPAAESVRQMQIDESQTAILTASDSETTLPGGATAAEATLPTKGEAAAGDPTEVAEVTKALTEPQVDTPDADSDRTIT